MNIRKSKNKLIVQRDPIELLPVNVTESILATKDAIKQNQRQLDDALNSEKLLQEGSEEYSQNKEFIRKCENNIKTNSEFLDQIRKYESWAEKIQVSKLKNEVEKHKDEMLKKVDYADNDMLSEKGNKTEKYFMYRSYISRVPEIEKNVHLSIVNKYLIMCEETDCIVPNPF